jgi:transcriptional regulator with XRE-family HTH domain
MSLGQRIIELRTEQKLSQNQLAKLMEVSRQAVSKWETDQSAPDSIKMIHLAEVLDTDIEYLTTGRRNFARRPPVVINTVETIEKIVEKPVVQVVEKVIEVEKIVETPIYVEKPIIKKVYRKQIIRNPLEFAVCGGICFLIGLLVGIFL